MARTEKSRAPNRSGSHVPPPDCIVGLEDSEPHDDELVERHSNNPLRRLPGSIFGNVAVESPRLIAVH